MSKPMTIGEAEQILERNRNQFQSIPGIQKTRVALRYGSVVFIALFNDDVSMSCAVLPKFIEDLPVIKEVDSFEEIS